MQTAYSTKVPANRISDCHVMAIIHNLCVDPFESNLRRIFRQKHHVSRNNIRRSPVVINALTDTLSVKLYFMHIIKMPPYYFASENNECRNVRHACDDERVIVMS